ncbi:carbamoyl phosphate synthase small subunit [Exiguobacterium sp. s46]|uniref:carbamoyl phosphate synthase small subunit n=1 Tax=Exiguobacterium sp. s46 TaxID=2751200 RepID=UPI001BEAE2A6|nr:carbamoyl phosphate synthase small subunit [Exiguobacterium sp. s46]
MKQSGKLTLANGTTFTGSWQGTAPVKGEVVFFTGMTGYQEVLTDPSYQGQILVFTYPLIGQYGIQVEASESNQIQVAGVIVQTLAEDGEGTSLASWLDEANVPILSGVDTRSLVHLLRTEGDQFGDMTQVDMTVTASIDTAYIASVSTTSNIEYVPEVEQGHIVCIDYGVKQSMIDALLERHMRVTVVPYNTTPERIQALAPDGLLFSNGPGDPTQLDPFLSGIRELATSYPTLGICMGHQVLAHAFGCTLLKQHHGHRGANHPVRHLASGQVFMTSQNHGYAVDVKSIEASEMELAYEHINDGSVEGLIHPVLPIMTVQFHPEASPGPTEAMVVFDQFVNSVLHQEVAYVG